MPPGSVRLSDPCQGQNWVVTDAPDDAAAKDAGETSGDAPIDKPTDAMVRSEPLGDHDVVIENEPTGPGVEAGGGEYPDPDTPPAEDYGAPC